MKIHHILTRNLNSLSGENKIDFTEAPLRDCGLFAITGPTGAGKSTILDAITLALYGKTPRIGKISANTIASQGVIVTTGKTDALAEVKWEMNGKVYLAQWIAHKGRVNWTVKMALSTYTDGDLVQLSVLPMDTPELVEKITKLDADRFTQAILLSQGKFDEFLQMNKNERYELLEVLTNIGIYRKLGVASHNRKTELENNISILTSTLGNIRLLTDEEESDLRKKRAALEAQLKQIKSNQNIAAIKRQIKEQIRSRETDLKDAREKSEENQLKLKAMADNQRRLKRYDSSMPMVSTHQKLISLRGNLASLEKDQETLVKQITDDKAEQTNLASALKSATGTEVTQTNFTSVLAEFISRISRLDDNIRDTTTQQNNAAARLKTDHERIPEYVRKQLLREAWADSAKVAALSDELRRQQLENLNLAGTGNPTEIIEKTELEIRELQEKVALIESRKRATLILENLRTEQAANSVRMKETSDKLSTLRKQSEGLDAEISAAETEAQREKSGELLAELRRNLIPGTPCPCCGSETHPHAGIPVVFTLDLLEILNVLKERKQRTEESIRQLDGEFYRQEILFHDGQSKISETEKELKVLETDTAAFNEDLITGDLNNLNRRKAAAQQLDKLELATDALFHYLKTLEEWRRTGQDLEKARLERQTAWSGPDVLAFSNDIRDKWNGNQTRVAERNKSLHAKTEKLNELQGLLKIQETDFHRNIQALGFADESDFTDASSLGNEAEKIREAIQHLADTATALKTRMDDAEKDLLELRNQDDPDITLDQLIEEIKQLEHNLDTIGQQKSETDISLGVQEDNRQEVARIQNQLATLQEKLRIAYKVFHYIGDATGNKFNNHVQRLTLRNLLVLANQRLQEMLGRYTLETGVGEDPDQIWLVDGHMADERRTVKTAAGGEKFMISLALALALSDMARNQVNIESMFIDEGFGTLGQEALANAIGLLEKLQADQGKIVGIISHVESLKEQIHTKIEVRPIGGGLSELHLTPKPATAAA